MTQFTTSMSSKGQVVIAKEIREQLGLKPNQKFVEEAKGNKIVLRAVPGLLGLKGSLRHVARKGKPLFVSLFLIGIVEKATALSFARASGGSLLGPWHLPTSQ